jgi:hypothetical protein
MLPVVIVGTDDTVSEAFDPWREAGIPVRRYATSEEAHLALSELEGDHLARLREKAADNQAGYVDEAEAAVAAVVATESTKPDDYIERSAMGEWQCTVVYGPATFGAAITGQPVILAHNGWTLVVARGLRDAPDQSAPRLVVEGMPQGIDPNTAIWQAATKLRAHHVVDADMPEALASVLLNFQARTYP